MLRTCHHAIIRANDALNLKFSGLKATRHDDAPVLFSKLLKQGKIGSENGRFLRLLQKTAVEKSGADYGKRSFTHKNADEYVLEAEEFVAFVKNAIS